MPSTVRSVMVMAGDGHEHNGAQNFFVMDGFLYASYVSFPRGWKKYYPSGILKPGVPCYAPIGGRYLILSSPIHLVEDASSIIVTRHDGGGWDIERHSTDKIVGKDLPEIQRRYLSSCWNMSTFDLYMCLSGTPSMSVDDIDKNNIHEWISISEQEMTMPKLEELPIALRPVYAKERPENSRLSEDAYRYFSSHPPSVTQASSDTVRGH